MRVLQEPVVLMYHGFARSKPDSDPFNLVVTTDHFARQLGLLTHRRLVPVDLDRYLAARERPARPRRVLVTIDDGFASVAELAAPLLARAGVPAVLFVPPGRIGLTSAWMPEFPDEAVMDADSVRAMHSFGIEIGVHGWDHTIMEDMSDAELHRHVVEARTALADVTGVLPRSFAYPEGRFDERARAAVEAAGYDVAFSVHRDEGRFAISRVDVNATDTGASFRLKLLPGYRRIWRAASRAAPLRRAVRRVAVGSG